MAFSDDGRAGDSPDRTDLRTFLWPVEHTGTIYAAAASAAVTALEYHCNRVNEPPTNLSSMFVHYNARKLKGYADANRGTPIPDALKAIATYGACREATWPFNEQAFNKEPPASAYAEAKKFAGVNYYSTDDAFQSLALGYPVPFFARMPLRCIREAGTSGVMPPLTDEEIRNEANHPGHGMTLVGYDKTAKVFTARNCWGESWGDKGYCTIPFKTMDVFCPKGARHLWVITLPQAGKEAAPPAPNQGTVSTQAETPSMAAQDLSKKLRDEIRSGLDKDLSEARKRIQDMLRKPGDR